MKRTLIALLASLMVLSSVFAGGAAEQTAATQDVALGSQAVEITFWHSASDEAGVLMDKYIKTFNETNPYQIKVNAIYQGQYSDATTLMKTIISAENYKELPDIMQLDATGKVDYFNSGKAWTVDDAIKEMNDDIIADYMGAAIGNWQFQGVQLGLPFASSTTITFYNKTLLTEAGWDRIPDTFEDLIQLRKDMDKAGITAATYGSVPSTPTLANWLGQLGSYVVNNSNGADATATKLECIDNGALETFLTEWKAMYDAGAVVNQSLSTNQFINGEVVVLTTSSSNVTPLLEKVNGKFEIAAGPFIRVNSSASYGATVSGSCLVMFDSGDSLKKKATWEFIKYLTGEEVQTDFAIATGYIPSYKASVESEAYKALLEENPQHAVGPDQLDKTPSSMRSVTVGPSADFYYAIMNGVSDMLKNNLSPKAATASMAENLQALLDQYARNNM